MLAEGGTASPHVRPGLGLSSSLGTWEAGLCVLSCQVTRNQLTIPQDRKGSSSHAEGRAVLG